jgi:hypothetical protein
MEMPKTGLRRLLVCLPLLGIGGCSWLPYLARNVVGTPVEVTESCWFRLQTCRLATQAWDEVVAQHPDQPYSPAYAHGFRTGFSDSVQRNGIPEPPAIPPCCYRYPVLRTPKQQQKIEDWFAGFRHGAQLAQEQRWRDGVIVPIARPPITTTLTYRQEVVPVPAAPTQSMEELPLPHKGPPVQEPPVPPADADRPKATPTGPPTAVRERSADGERPRPLPQVPPPGASVWFDPNQPVRAHAEEPPGRPPAVACGPPAPGTPLTQYPVAPALTRLDASERMPKVDEMYAPCSMVLDMPARPYRSLSKE